MTDIHDTAAPLTDVHDMVVVHRAFRREFTLLPGLVRDVAPGDVARAAVLAGHARLCLAGLHLHHTSEDELLWPLLERRARPSADLVARMESQHHRVEALVDGLQDALDRWEVEARPAVTAEVAAGAEGLAAALLEHLDEEEREILPVAARHVTPEEWAAVGEHGLARVERAHLPLMFGMVIEEATPDERREMLGKVPFPVRLLLRTWGARHYARYVRRVRTPAAARRA